MSYIFIRHGKLDLPYSSHADMPFSVLCELATGKLNPPADIAFLRRYIEEMNVSLPLLDVTGIFCGMSERTRTTAHFLADHVKHIVGRTITVIPTSNANEIVFDIQHLTPSGKEAPLSVINKIVSRSPFRHHCDRCETGDDILKRVERLFDEIDARGLNGTILVVTNGFFLQHIEAYVRTCGNTTEDAVMRCADKPYLHGLLIDDKRTEVRNM